MPSCSPTDWRVVDVEADRQSDLQVRFDLEGLAARIATDASAVVFRKERGRHEAKGSWRPTFTLEVSRQLFDQFFNNPCGYRGHYLAGPELGTSANLRLLETIAPRLLAAVPESTVDGERIQESLGSRAAKIWIDEDQHDPRVPELRVQVQVATWVAAATAAHERLKAADPTLTPKEIDRIFGVRAPSGTQLRVFGAWVGDTGVQPVVPSKQRRAVEIHGFGVS
ncbi:MAG: hypothetical protein HZC37_26720 [Burkholderiales bacterium]|nr:hypothetical protein [Burkholderiales bacterium]